MKLFADALPQRTADAPRAIIDAWLVYPLPAR